MSEIRDRRFCAWRVQPQRSMRPPRVVVRRVFGEHPTQVPLPEDQHPVGVFGSDRQQRPSGL